MKIALAGLFILLLARPAAARLRGVPGVVHLRGQGAQRYAEIIPVAIYSDDPYRYDGFDWSAPGGAFVYFGFDGAKRSIALSDLRAIDFRLAGMHRSGPIECPEYSLRIHRLKGKPSLGRLVLMELNEFVVSGGPMKELLLCGPDAANNRGALMKLELVPRKF